MQSECAFNLSRVFGKEAVLEKKREGEGSEKRRRGKGEGEGSIQERLQEGWHPEHWSRASSFSKNRLKKRQRQREKVQVQLPLVQLGSKSLRQP